MGPVEHVEMANMLLRMMLDIIDETGVRCKGKGNRWRSMPSEIVQKIRHVPGLWTDTFDNIENHRSFSYNFEDVLVAGVVVEACACSSIGNSRCSSSSSSFRHNKIICLATYFTNAYTCEHTHIAIAAAIHHR